MAVAALVSAASLALAGSIEITHEPVACVVADRHPRYEARFQPAAAVGQGRLRFRPARGRHWYSVPFRLEGDVFAAVLPKPKKGLGHFLYYVEVTARDVSAARTAEFTATVEDGPGACRGRTVAASVASATVAVEAPAGAPALPAGFSGSGVQAAAAAAATGAAGGGGAAKAALIVAGTAAAAGGAVVAASAEGEGGDGESRMITLGGTVLRAAGQGGVGPAIAGAVVSTSLDASTATTDGSGRFQLVTSTRVGQGYCCNPYTVMVAAPGCPLFSNTAVWGERPDSMRIVVPCP